ncbi:MAG: hypothetical protein KAI50_07660 [Desulfobacterales bacterium]|nr:hypothetical protein [Desulfobacterales bacterium]
MRKEEFRKNVIEIKNYSKKRLFPLIAMALWILAMPMAEIAAAKPVHVLQQVDTDITWLPLRDDLQKKPLQYPANILTTKHFNFTTISSGLNIKTITKKQVTYHQLLPPGGRLLGEIGKPGLPGFTRLIAVPKGAEIQIKINEGTPRVIDGYVVYPIQEQPEDNKEFQPHLFTIDQAFYKTDVTYPDTLFTIEYDWIRGCKIALVHVHTARYNPSRKKLIYYPELEVDIQFEGGEDFCIPMDKRSGFFEDTYTRIIANYEVVKAISPELTLFRGYDLLIITPAAFEGQADELAEWKREKGFLTKVVTLDDIDAIEGGTTAEDIRAYINDVYDTYNLSYVLLIGDAEFIPPHYVTPHPTGHGNTLMGTDLYYAEMDYAGYFPDLAVGRIPVDTVAEAQIVVDKIINYEQNPPIDQDFYRTILCAAFFQDDDRDGIAEASDSDGRAQREFAETMEDIRTFFLSEGYPACPRIYATDSPDPQYWRDGSTIPAALRMPGFPWDGDADDIAAAINSGTFLVAHRDHGGRTGWGDPDFHIGDLADLTNNELLPVVLSINCQTGWFDNETDDLSLHTGLDSECFAEEFLRMEGGSVAVIAATRNSPSYPNNALTLGFLDCIWNEMIPGYPAEADINADELEGSRRLGDALNYAKIYVSTLYDSVSACQRPFEIYHCLGDPTMEIWTASPHTTSACYPELPEPALIYTGSEDYTVRGNEYTRYRLEVTNSEAFPDEMFASAPHLPPCGLNNNSSRTWVSIYDNDDTRLYGFCGFDSSDDLDLLWFAVPKGTSPLDSVYIVLNDRECDITYTSDLVALSKSVSLKRPDIQYKLVSTQAQKLQSGVTAFLPKGR